MKTVLAILLVVLAFKLDPAINNYTVFDVSNALRERGWLLPAYTFPANRTDLAARGARSLSIVTATVVNRPFTGTEKSMSLCGLRINATWKFATWRSPISLSLDRAICAAWRFALETKGG